MGEFPSETIKKVEVIGEGPVHGLFVGDDNTKIEYLKEASYLDGDIWIALKYEEGEHMISRFLDLGDIEDFEDECEKLKEDIKNICSKLSNSKVILQFDQIHRLLSVKQTIEIGDCWKKLYNKSK